MTKIVGVNEWSEVTLLEDGDKLSGGINGKANEQSIALVNRTNWLKEKIEDDTNGANTSEDEKLLWLSTNLADPLLSSKSPKVGQVLAVSETKSNLSGKETLTYKLIDLPVGGTKGETGPAGPQGEQGVQGEYGSFANVTNRGQWYPWDTYAINDMVRYRMDGGTVDQTYVSRINGNLDNPPNPLNEDWAMISQDGRDAQGSGGSAGVESLNTFSGTVAIQGSGSATIDNQGNIITVNVPAAPVLSVNGKTGVVSLNYEDIGAVSPDHFNYRIGVESSALVGYVDEQLGQATIYLNGQLNIKANSTDVRALAGTRLWVSGEYQPVANTPTIATHGLNIDPTKCRCDVLLVCKVAEQGYSLGDYAMGATTRMDAGNNAPLVPMLSKNAIQMNTGAQAAYLLFLNKANGTPAQPTSLANWRYIFRIWY